MLVTIPALVRYIQSIESSEQHTWYSWLQDERWVHDRKFAFYVFPPTRLKNGSYIPGAKETWMSFMSCVLDDIWWLCELPYHKLVDSLASQRILFVVRNFSSLFRFWSQIIYNKNSINGVKSFLHLAPLEKLYYRTKDSDILSTHISVKKAVFQFLKRVSRSKESEVFWRFISIDQLTCLWKIFLFN